MHARKHTHMYREKEGRDNSTSFLFHSVWVEPRLKLAGVTLPQIEEHEHVPSNRLPFFPEKYISAQRKTSGHIEYAHYA